MLGLDQQLFVGAGCDTHYGEEVPSTAKYSVEACRDRVVLDIPQREEVRTVQDELDVLHAAWEGCHYSRQTQSGPCPMCSTHVPTVTVAQRMLGGEPPTHFFVAAARTSEEGANVKGAAKPSVCVSAFEKTYRLCAVIFQCASRFERFSCQAFYGGCWHANESWTGERIAEHRHVYEACPFPPRQSWSRAPEPVFFAYVREDEELRRGVPDSDSDEYEPRSLAREQERVDARNTFASAMRKVTKTAEILAYFMRGSSTR